MYKQNLYTTMTPAKPICGDCILLFMNKWWIKVPNAPLLLQKKASRSRGWHANILLIHDKGLSTAISQVQRRLRKKLPISTRLQMWRLRKWQIRSEYTHLSIETLPKQWLNLNRLSSKVSIFTANKRKSRRCVQKSTRQRLSPRQINQRQSRSCAYAACRKANH